MPLTVITLKNSSPSLRGDLSKWMQEIATGVYIGNFNSRIREQLWQRVKESVGNGEATLSFVCRNEIGYAFETHNTHRKVIDYEGIPLVLLPLDNEAKEEKIFSKNFSKARKFHQAKKYTSQGNTSNNDFGGLKPFVVLDIETDGLDYRENSIIEIGAIKVEGQKIHSFQRLIKNEKNLPKKIVNLTGISDNLLSREGFELKETIVALRKFISSYDLVGYNIHFDLSFINYFLKINNSPLITNKIIDIMSLVKKDNRFLSSYKLEEVLKSYGIHEKVPHRAQEDAMLIYQLAIKVNGFLKLVQKD